MDRTLIRRLLGALLFTACGAAVAQTAALPLPPSYAVFSQVAREVTVTGFQESTGSRLGNNSRQRIAVPDGALDTAAVVMVGQTLRKASPGATVWLVAPTDEDLFDPLQNAAEGARVAIPDDLAAAMRERGSTHLLLFTRFRADASLQTRDFREGTGQLDGLGYFVDRQTLIKRSDTNQTGVGFLAPYAHFRGTLIDVGTRRVLLTRTATYGHVLSAARAQGGSTHPWDVLTPAEKMTTLRDILRSEIERMVPELLAKP